MIFTGAERTRARKIFISIGIHSAMVAVRATLACGRHPQGNRA
jgi:hypothetical protein